MVGELGVGISICSGLVGAAAIMLLVWRRTAIASTTLLYPWGWSILSIGAIAGTELILAFGSADGAPAWQDAARFAAAATLFCPLMAALGAKRPQDKPWQLIVVSLWAVVSLPAMRHLLLQPDQPLTVRGLPAWFLGGLIAISLANFLPTRFWPSAIFAVAAQLLLLGTYLPVPLPLAASGSVATLAGMISLLLAIALPAAGLPRSRSAVQPEDRLWLDFRDGFGLLWGLRVAERINAAAEVSGWNVRLTWGGFQSIDPHHPEGAESVPPELAPALQRTMRNLLRRFASRQWIAERLASQDKPVVSPSAPDKLKGPA